MAISGSQHEHVEMEARWLRDGRILPSVIYWRGNRHPVLDVGRQWSEQAGGHSVRCLLVRLSNGQTLELALDTDAWMWHVRQSFSTSGAA